MYKRQVVICGYAEETEKDQTPNVGFVWADDSYWNQIKRPAVKWVKGKYPTKENEVMASVDALKAVSYTHLDVYKRQRKHRLMMVKLNFQKQNSRL